LQHTLDGAFAQLDRLGDLFHLVAAQAHGQDLPLAVVAQAGAE
jgi:hypothetical protein